MEAYKSRLPTVYIVAMCHDVIAHTSVHTIDIYHICTQHAVQTKPAHHHLAAKDSPMDVHHFCMEHGPGETKFYTFKRW